LLVRVGNIGSALRPCQIDEAHFAIFLAVVFQLHLKDSMRAGTVGVGARLARGAALEAHADISHYVLSLSDLLLSEAHNINLLFGIFTAYNFLALIKQIK
jgi:hypothetical protein